MIRILLLVLLSNLALGQVFISQKILINTPHTSQDSIWFETTVSTGPVVIEFSKKTMDFRGDIIDQHVHLLYYNKNTFVGRNQNGELVVITILSKKEKRKKRTLVILKADKDYLMFL